MSTLADVKKNTEQRMHKSLDALKPTCPKSAPPCAHGAARPHLGGLLRQPDADSEGRQRKPARRPHPRRIAWEKKMLGVIEKAIRESDLG